MRQSGDEIIDWNQSNREIFNFITVTCSYGRKAVSWINEKQISINRDKMIPGSHVYKNREGQVIGKTQEGFLIKTEDTMLEIIEYTYEGKVRIGDRLQSHE